MTIGHKGIASDVCLCAFVAGHDVEANTNRNIKGREEYL